MSKSYLGDKDVFSANLIYYIEKSQLTQKEVAKRIKVTESSLTDWVTKRHYPRLDKIQLLAEVFGIQMTDLVEPRNTEKKIAAEKEKKLLELFHKVPDEKKDHLLKVVQAVIDTL